MLRVKIAAGGALDAGMARDDLFCIMGCGFGVGCGVDSYAQCLAAAAGCDAWCAVNPAFQRSRASRPVSYAEGNLDALSSRFKAERTREEE